MCVCVLVCVYVLVCVCVHARTHICTYVCMCVPTYLNPVLHLWVISVIKPHPRLCLRSLHKITHWYLLFTCELYYFHCSALMHAYFSGNASLCDALIRNGGHPAAMNRQGVTIFNAPVATKQLLFRVLSE